MPEQLRALDVPVEKSVFYEPLLKMPASISANVQEELRAKARQVIEEDVIQSFKDLGEMGPQDAVILRILHPKA